MSGAARQLNSRKNAEEFDRLVVRLESRPRMIFVELTRGCNLHCSMCRPRLLAGPQYVMPHHLLQKIREQLFPFVETVDLRGSGESTLDTRLLPLTRELIEMGVNVNLYSNLTTKNPEFWEELGALHIQVAISLDAVSSKLLSVLRGGAHIQKIIKNLEGFSRGRRRSRSTSLISAVVSDGNLQELSLLVELAARFEIPVVRLNPITLPQPDGLFPRIGVSPRLRSALREQLERARIRAQELGVHLHLAATLDNSGEGGFSHCLHPWSYCVIEYDGAIVFCDHLVANERAQMGNLIHGSFMDVWNGESYRMLRTEHRNKQFSRLDGLGLECSWCHKNRFADCETHLDERFAPKVVNSEVIGRIDCG